MSRQRFCTSLAAAMLVAAPAARAELIFAWSFVADAGYHNSPDGVGHMVRGTIAGLVEGDNDGTNLEIMVTQTPNGELLGGDWHLLPGSSAYPAFQVTAGKVAFAEATFGRSLPDDSWYLRLIADPANANSPADNYPFLSDGIFHVENGWSNRSGNGTRFVAIPETSSLVTTLVAMLATIHGFRRQFWSERTC